MYNMADRQTDMYVCTQCQILRMCDKTCFSIFLKAHEQSTRVLQFHAFIVRATFAGFAFPG